MRAEHRMPTCNCPTCGEEFSYAAPAFGNINERPREGSISVCIVCGGLMAFTKDMMLRTLTEQERRETEDDPFLEFLLEVRAKFIKEQLQ